MEFEQIIELIKTVSSSNLTGFELKQEDMKISMSTDKCPQVVVAGQPQAVQAPVMAAVPATPAEGAAAQAEEDTAIAAGNQVKSPLVGTFYNAANPESEPFVKVGDTVKKGQTIGIVEAMKLMNEIECEFDGVVKQILVENEAMVEYGQPLFVIE